MALSVHSLASGSSGNSILIRDDHSAVLIDAGIGILKLKNALEQVETNPADISAIFITHEHSDHIAGAVRMARRYQVPIIANAPTLQAIDESESVPTHVLDAGGETAIGDLLVRSFPISHDAACPVGYTIEAPGAAVCSATDTGILTPEIRDEAVNADLLILESNHDAEMLVKGPYPWYLKRRIAGECGHLSNDTAAGLIVDLAEMGKSMCVWLAHLSKTNNSPWIALSTAQYLLWTCSGAPLDIQVALRDRPSAEWKQEDRPIQLSLF